MYELWGKRISDLNWVLVTVCDKQYAEEMINKKRYDEINNPNGKYISFHLVPNTPPPKRV